MVKPKRVSQTTRPKVSSRPDHAGLCLHIQGSGDGAWCPQKGKADCDCDADHPWWMAIKIGDLNEVIQRLHPVLVCI